MFPFAIRPDRAAQEIISFNQKLTRGLMTMSEVGKVDVGVTPKDAVYREDKLTLYRFKPMVEQPLPVPVLIAYALVNRPYMADLQEDRSLIRRMLEAGLDVYLIDWGYPDGADRYLGLDDYINGYMRRCVDHICERHGMESINILGICQGGTFSVCFSALHPEKVRNLVAMVTPVDFQTPGNMLSASGRATSMSTCLVDTLGNMPGELLELGLPRRSSRSASPGRSTSTWWTYWTTRSKLKNFVRMEKWIFDSPDQAGEAFRQFIKDFYQNNGLIKGEVTIGDRRVDLKNVTMPVLNVYATEDHLVPPASSVALKDCIGTKDYKTLTFKGGHIGIYVSARAQKEIPSTISAWLRDRI